MRKSKQAAGKLGIYHYNALKFLGRGDVNKGLRLVLRAYIDNPVAVMGSRFPHSGGTPSEKIVVSLTNDLVATAQNAGGSVVEGIKIALEAYKGGKIPLGPRKPREPREIKLKLAPEHMDALAALVPDMAEGTQEAHAEAIKLALIRCKSKYGYRRVKIDKETARTICIPMDEARIDKAMALGDGTITRGVRRALDRLVK